MSQPTHARVGRFGFTLIELLIVVAIIAILAAIAIPNFLEAQTRSRVSRVKGDLRTQAIALDSYYVDHSHYTKDNEAALDAAQGPTLAAINRANGSLELTTPLSYMSTLLSDPFQPVDNSIGATSTTGYRIASGDWSYNVIPPSDDQDSYQTFQNHGPSECYMVMSPGPDRTRARLSYKCFPWEPEDASGHVLAVASRKDTSNAAKLAAAGGVTFYLDYDPTNGTVSVGDIYRYGGDFMSGNWNRYYENSDGTGSGPGGAMAN
jgi:prepilin-type N-terminal cleavage/methylation domain-containing protein